MTDNDKVRLIGKMIEDYWGATEGDDAKSLTALAEILRRVTEEFPEATVAAEAGTPCGAALTVRWDAWGEIAETQLTIQTKKEESKC